MTPGLHPIRHSAEHIFRNLDERAKEMQKFAVLDLPKERYQLGRSADVRLKNEAALIKQEYQRFEENAQIANAYGQTLLRDNKFAGREGQEALDMIEKQIVVLNGVANRLSRFINSARGSDARFVALFGSMKSVCDAISALEKLAEAGKNQMARNA